jgi:hypothetical protein
MAEKTGYASINGYYYLETGQSKFTAETLALVAEILDVPTMDELLMPHTSRR